MMGGAWDSNHEPAEVMHKVSSVGIHAFSGREDHSFSQIFPAKIATATYKLPSQSLDPISASDSAIHLTGALILP